MLILDVISLIFSVIATGFAVFTYLVNVLHDKRKATLEAYNVLQEQALDKLYIYSPTEIRDIVKKNRSEEYKQISVYVARIEHFAVGVKQNIYDWKTIYELSHGFLDGSIKSRIEIVINEKNKKFGCDFYCNIHFLYNKMEKEAKKRNRLKQISRILENKN